MSAPFNPADAAARLELLARAEREGVDGAPHLGFYAAARNAIRPLVEYVGVLEHRLREFEAGAVQRELLRGLPCKCSPDDVQAAREMLDWVHGKCPNANAVHVLRDAVGALDQLRDAVVDARRVEGRLESERLSTGLAVVEALEERNVARSERDTALRENEELRAALAQQQERADRFASWYQTEIDASVAAVERAEAAESRSKRLEAEGAAMREALGDCRRAIEKWDAADESAEGGWADNAKGEAVYDALHAARTKAWWALETTGDVGRSFLEERAAMTSLLRDLDDYLSDRGGEVTALCVRIAEAVRASKEGGK